MKLVGKAILVVITVAMAVTMSFLVVIPNGTAKAQDSTFTVNSTGDTIDQSHPAQIVYSGDDIVVTMSLTGVSDQLTFNQSHVEDNRLEYSWGVRIDTDGNVSTGDGAGYDVEISLTHFKPPGNSPFTGTILDGTQKNTWVLSGSSYLFAHNIEAEIDHDTKSIIMIAKQSWEEFADFDINDRFCCKTYYYSPSGSVQDITSDNPPGSNIVSDPEGDVSYSFVDITGGKVQLPDTIQPSVSLTNHVISHTADYSVTFTIAEDVAEGEYIIIAFPAGTYITNIDATDCTIAATSGIGSDAFVATKATSISKSDETLTITLPDVNTQDKIGTGATVEVIANDVINPPIPGDYTLTVATSGETTPVESASYAIETPTIPPVPGIVQLYNPVDILMAQYTGDDAIQSAIDDAWAGWTVKVGAGTYTEGVADFVYDSLTIVSTDSAATTIINGAWTVNKASMTLDGLTINGEMTITGDKATVKNCAIGKNNSAGAEDLLTFNVAAGTGSVTGCTFDTTLGATVDNAIVVTTAGLTVSSCSFILDSGDTAVATANAVTVKDCPSITGSGGIGVAATAGTSTILGSTFDGLATAFNITAGAVLTIKQNTIKNSTGDAINIAGAATKATITGNDINTTAATKYAVVLAADVVANANVFVMFNNITDNTLNVKNAHVTLTLDATHNWWGAATGPVSTSISGLVNTSAYLSGAVTSGAGAIAINQTSLAAKTTAGVDVTADAAAGVIGASQYAANPAPGAPPYPALANGYFDVYVGTPGAITTITIKLYGAVTADTGAYVWSALGGTWIKCSSQAVNIFGGFVYITVDITTVPSIVDLAGLPFALVEPPAEPAIEATIDFNPDTLNLKSKGKVVTVYIELPEGYDVEEIDISTVMLNGIVPALAHPTDVGDYDSDGVPDLMVKFDRSDVQDVLEPGNEVEVTVSGQLTDGTSFEGADTIRVIAKGKK